MEDSREDSPLGPSSEGMTIILNDYSYVSHHLCFSVPSGKSPKFFVCVQCGKSHRTSYNPLNPHPVLVCLPPRSAYLQCVRGPGKRTWKGAKTQCHQRTHPDEGSTGWTRERDRTITPQYHASGERCVKKNCLISNTLSLLHDLPITSNNIKPVPKIRGTGFWEYLFSESIGWKLLQDSKIGVDGEEEAYPLRLSLAKGESIIPFIVGKWESIKFPSLPRRGEGRFFNFLVPPPYRLVKIRLRPVPDIGAIEFDVGSEKRKTVLYGTEYDFAERDQ